MFGISLFGLSLQATLVPASSLGWLGERDRVTVLSGSERSWYGDGSARAGLTAGWISPEQYLSIWTLASNSFQSSRSPRLTLLLLLLFAGRSPSPSESDSSPLFSLMEGVSMLVSEEMLSCRECALVLLDRSASDLRIIMARCSSSSLLFSKWPDFLFLLKLMRGLHRLSVVGICCRRLCRWRRMCLTANTMIKLMRIVAEMMGAITQAVPG